MKENLIIFPVRPSYILLESWRVVSQAIMILNYLLNRVLTSRQLGKFVSHISLL